jgi:probable rRNA maturation factor
MKPHINRMVQVISKVPVMSDIKSLQQLVENMLIRKKEWLNFEIALFLIDDDAIRKLKRKYFGLRRITDVISLNYTTIPGFLEGEIYISVQTAQRQADDYGVGLQQEIQRLAAHGVLHLFGYTDDNDEQRRQMSRLEDRALAHFKNKP